MTRLTLETYGILFSTNLVDSVGPKYEWLDTVSEPGKELGQNKGWMTDVSGPLKTSTRLPVPCRFIGDGDCISGRTDSLTQHRTRLHSTPWPGVRDLWLCFRSLESVSGFNKNVGNHRKDRGLVFHFSPFSISWSFVCLQPTFLCVYVRIVYLCVCTRVFNITVILIPEFL